MITRAERWPRARPSLPASSPSSFSWISCVLFPMQEQAADEQDQIAPGDLLPSDREQRRRQAHDPR